MKTWPQEFRKRVIGNFKAPKKAAHVSAQKRREGNDAKHLALLRQLPCCIPGCRSRPPNDPHHLRSGPAHAERAFGRKSTDRRAVPACRQHHEGAHSVPPSKEINHFKELGIDDIHALADALFKGPRTVEGLTRIVMAHRQD